MEGEDEQRKHLLQGGESSGTRCREWPGKQPPSAKKGVLRRRLRESGKQTGFVKSLRQKKILGKCEHMLSSDKHPSACSELTKALAAPRCLIKPTTNKPLWVQSRGEQGSNQGCNWCSTLLGEGRVGGSRTRRYGGGRKACTWL